MINFRDINLVMSAGRPDQFPKDRLPQIALSGRSNVGKSSLINTISGRKNYAHTSSAPGKTITVNFYLVDKKFYLVDLPGYGFAKRSGDRQQDFSNLTEKFLMENDSLKYILQLVDLKVGPTSDDIMMIDWMNANKMPYSIVATKADKLNVTDRKNNYEALDGHPYLCPPYASEKKSVYSFSSLKGDGKEDICKLISTIVK